MNLSFGQIRTSQNSRGNTANDYLSDEETSDGVPGAPKQENTKVTFGTEPT